VHSLPIELVASSVVALLPWQTSWYKLDGHSLRSSLRALAAFCRCCQRFDMVVKVGGLWRQAVIQVLWPMDCLTLDCTEDANNMMQRDHESQINVLRSSGEACRQLLVNCLHVSANDLHVLGECCPCVEALHLSFYGPSMTDDYTWIRSWCQTLACVSIHWWYDDSLGGACITKMLTEIGVHCQVLVELVLTGVDWPRAKSDIQAVLLRSWTPGSWQALKCVRLQGSQQWSSAELNILQSRGVRVETIVLDDRTR